MIAFRTDNKHLPILLILFLYLPINAHAQIGNCEPASAEAYLDAGNVQARILNDGGLFLRGLSPGYEVPKDKGIHALTVAGTWVGGFIENQIRTAVSVWGRHEFWPGPLDEAGNPPEDCIPFDKIWEIRKQDIESFLSTGETSDNLQDWPWHLGAPVVDKDGVPDNYNLQGGDLPELLGDQRLWWVMNDRGNEHVRSESEPIGLEVHGSAHSFSLPGPVGNITFYQYKLINKNSFPFEEAYFSLFSSSGIGNINDDYSGSDSLLHLGYTYNSDNLDENNDGYGAAPPAIGITFLESIFSDADGLDNDRNGRVDEAGEMLGASSFLSSGSADEASNATAFYNFMQGRFIDGSTMAEGMSGRYQPRANPPWPSDLPRKPTKFSFSGDPVIKSFWSEFNIDNKRTTSGSAGVRHFVMSSGPFGIETAEAVEVRFAIIWSRGKDHLDSITALKKDVKAVRGATDVFYSPTIIETPVIPPPNYVLGFDQNFPNPFSSSTTLRYSLPQSMQVRLAVYDMLGREIRVLVEQAQEPGIYAAHFDAKQLPPGIYLARLELDYLNFTKRMVLLR